MDHDWLLKSILRCGPRGGTLRDIIATGDYLNHAIFTREELRTGLTALFQSGQVREKDGKWLARKRPGPVAGTLPTNKEIDRAIREYTDGSQGRT